MLTNAVPPKSSMIYANCSEEKKKKKRTFVFHFEPLLGESNQNKWYGVVPTTVDDRKDSIENLFSIIETFTGHWVYTKICIQSIYIVGICNWISRGNDYGCVLSYSFAALHPKLKKGNQTRGCMCPLETKPIYVVVCDGRPAMGTISERANLLHNWTLANNYTYPQSL